MDTNFFSKSTYVNCTRRRVIFFYIFLTVFCGPVFLSATDYVWDGGTGGPSTDWTDVTNWVGDSGYPNGINDTATFNGTDDDDGNIPAGMRIGALTINSDYNGTVTMEGAVTIDNSGTETGVFTFNTSGAAGELDMNGFDLTVLSNFAMSDGIFNAGEGLLIVSGDFTHSGGEFNAETSTVMFGGNVGPSDRTLTLSGGTTFNNVCINDGLLGYWKLDEAASPAIDYSGYGHNATWVGNVAQNTTTATGIEFANTAAAEFDGSGDYLTAGYVQSISSLREKFTLCAWIQPDDLTGVHRVISLGLNSNDGWGFGTNGTGMRFTTYGIQDYNSTTITLVTGTWYFVACVFDSSNDVTFYVYDNDGTYQKSQTITGGAPANLDLDDMFSIGAKGDISESFDGAIDEVRVYNRVLTVTELVQLAAGNQPSTTASTTTLIDDLDVNGDLVLAAGTLSSGSNTIRVAQNWWNYGGVFTPGTGIVTFDGTTNTYTLQGGGQAFYDLNIDDSGSTAYKMSLSGLLDVDGNLGIIDGDLDVDSTGNYTIDLGGDWGMQSGNLFVEHTGTVIVSGDSTIKSSGEAFNNLMINDGLIGYWKLDETVSPALDSSGYGHSGTWYGDTAGDGSVATGINFKNSGCVSLDGSADYILVPDLTWPAAGGPITIAFWRYIELAQLKSEVTFGFKDETNDRIQAHAPYSGGTIYWDYGNISAGGRISTGYGGANYGKWTHIVMVSEGNGGAFKAIYLNGSVANSAASSDGPDIARLGFGIGTFYTGTSSTAIGRIDDFRIYNRVLTVSEVVQLAAGNQPSTTASTTTLIDDLDVNGDFVLAAGTLNDGGQNFTLQGSWLNYGGVFISTGAVTLDGSAIQEVASGGQSFVKLFNNGTQSYFSENVTFDTSLIVHSGVVTAGPVSIYFGAGDDFRVGGGAASQAIVSFDGTIVTSDSSTGRDKYTMSIQPGGDICAKQGTRFNFLYGGILFHTGSRMGSNTAACFQNVTFDNIDDGNFGLDLTLLVGGDDGNFPDQLEEIRFNIIAGETTAKNVSADASTPNIIFNLSTGHFGSVATDGEAGDEDPSDKADWTGSTTWVALSEFKALGALVGDGVDVEWKTTAELDNQGFNVYRSFTLHGDYVKVNSALIKTSKTAAQSFTGEDYSHFDPLPVRGSIVYYKLEDIDKHNKKTSHGPVCVDWDRDGLPDDWEKANGFDNLDPSDALLDSDGDGLSNLDEYKYGFDPRSADTDQDGILDGAEAKNIWNGEIIPGINAGGTGLTIIGQDQFGITFELDVNSLIKKPVTHRYSGWSNTKKKFKQAWKEEDYYSLSFGNMPTEYGVKINFPKLPMKRVLLNLPNDRTIETKVLKETWAASWTLDRFVEPLPTFQERPISKNKWIKELVKHGQIKKHKKKDNMDITSKHGKNKFGFSALFGGRKHKENYFDEVVESETSDEYRDSLEEEEIYGTPDSKLVDVYARDRLTYTTNTLSPNSYFEAGKVANVGGQQVILLGVKPVQYNPVTGELKYLTKLRFRVNYIYDPKVIAKKTSDWRVDYDAVNKIKPAYLNHAEIVQIKVKKPAYSNDGDINDRTLAKLTWTDLTNLGLTWNTDPDKIRLFQGPHELSLKQVADGLVFYLDRGINESLNNNQVTLYAFSDPLQNGTRWGTKASELTYDQDLVTFNQTVRFEENKYLMYMVYSPDTIFASNTNAYGGWYANQAFNLPGVATTGSVSLSTRMYNLFDFDPINDIGAKLTLNSQPGHYVEVEWPAHTFLTQTNSLNANLFTDGANNLNYEAVLKAGTPWSQLRVDYLEVIYPRTLKASSEKLLVNHKFATGKTRVKVTGFTTPANITVVDVSDPTNISEVSGVLTGGDYVEVNLYGSTLTDPIKSSHTTADDSDYGDNDPKWTRDESANTKLLFMDLSSAVSITSIKKVLGNTAIRGRQSGLDHMIVVDESLYVKAQELVDHLTAQGQLVEMVKFQDLCKEYMQGEYSTSAIHKYTKERWKTAEFSRKPQYLTLIGSGNFNTVGLFTNAPNELPLIPSPMLATNQAKKAGAADWEYAKITDDVYPDISVGRLDAGTVTELGNIIDKIKVYENSSVGNTNPKAVMVTDHEPTFDIYQFDGYMNTTLKSFESPWTYSQLYRSAISPSNITAGILDALNNQQTNLLLFNGHGSFREWGSGFFFTHSHLNSLQNGHFLPVVVEANCLSSDFYHTVYRSLGTQLLQKANAGAIAVIGNTSMTTAANKSFAFQSIIDHLLRRGFPEVGKALRRAKIESLVISSDKDNSVSSMHLLGLPSLKLKGVN